MMRRFCRLYLAVALCSAQLTGCDASIEGTLETNSIYTLFGQLDVDADTQAVRVIAISATLDSVDPEDIDAEVTLQNLQTGEERTWADSLVSYGDGTRGHVFYAPLQVSFDEQYRLEVRRSDGALSSVSVTVPPETTLDSLGRESTPDEVFYVVSTLDAPRLTGVEARYTLIGGEASGLHIIRHSDRVERIFGGWKVPIPFVSDVRRLLFRSVPGTVVLVEFEVRVYVSNEDWHVEDAGGVFDSEVLVEPGVLSNVENGFGFFGAGYRLVLPMQPQSQDLLRAGLCLLNEAGNGCR